MSRHVVRSMIAVAVALAVSALASPIATPVANAEVPQHVLPAGNTFEYPEITVSGKYCPEWKSAYNRRINIPRSKKNGTKLCVITISDFSTGVWLKLKTTIKKKNDYRLKVTLFETPLAYRVSHLDMGDVTIIAHADALRLGKTWKSAGGLATRTYPSVAGKAFTVQGRFHVTQIPEKYECGKGECDFIVTSTALKFGSIKSVK